MIEFRKLMENQSLAIDQTLNKIAAERVTTNRKKLNSILRIVIFCGCENLALQGHRDDSQHYDNDSVGKFQALLDFEAECGDKVLKEHFKTFSKRASYRSKTKQNELIACCGTLIVDAIVKETNHSSFLLILADEATDCSNKEQICR